MKPAAAFWFLCNNCKPAWWLCSSVECSSSQCPSTYLHVWLLWVHQLQSQRRQDPQATCVLGLWSTYPWEKVVLVVVSESTDHWVLLSKVPCVAAAHHSCWDISSTSWGWSQHLLCAIGREQHLDFTLWNILIFEKWAMQTFKNWLQLWVK